MCFLHVQKKKETKEIFKKSTIEIKFKVSNTFINIQTFKNFNINNF